MQVEQKKNIYQITKKYSVKKRKEYELRNKDKISEYKKQYRKENLETLLEKEKQFREQNKEKLREYVLCDCGCNVFKTNLSRHKLSKKHQNLIQ